VRRHGGQAPGGAQADAVEGHLIDTVFHRGNAGFLGNLSQLAPGFVALCLETEGIVLVVARGGVVVRLRGVVRQGWIRDRRRGRIPLDEPETKGIVRNRRKSGKNRKRS
jgi:hypothetical protein